MINKLYHIFIYVNYFFKIFSKSMAHNVPAVYDGLAARIRKCAAFPGPTNCGGVLAWEWSEAK
jgi:hypothetical protein